MSNSALDAIKAPPPVGIRLVRDLEKEIGKGQARAIVGKAIVGAYVDCRKMKGCEANFHPRVEYKADSGFPVEREFFDDADKSHGHNIPDCQLVEFFRQIGEPEMDALVTCGVDYAAENLIRPEWEFVRMQTRMQGASHCDFRWCKG